MELIERDDFLVLLNNGFRKAALGEGHCFFISGEAGMGKTSLVKAFLKQVENKSIEYTGACDSLFTPRPLAPLYDLALQIKQDWTDKIHSIVSRTELFARFVQRLTHQDKPVILVFEDIHWADEATLDFIKFFARRIGRAKCLFILTFRDDEISEQHPLRNVLGGLAPDTFSRIQLTPLSLEAVHKLADEKGYDAENVYGITGGNPFYVNEILETYSPGVPDNIKDSILSVYNRQEEKTKSAWQFLSVIPEGLELNRLTKVDPSWEEAIGNSLAKKILVIRNARIYFKHELYRRTIEGSLSPFKRIALNKCLLDLFLKTFEQDGEIERIVHYAKNANENDLVVQYAPVAAKQAASVGAHIESSKLFLTSIEYSDRKDTDNLVKLYEAYAYECYLTNQIKDAIIYQGKALKIWRDKDQVVQIGNSLRFLSRLWWFEGSRVQAEDYGRKAIEVLDKQPSSKEKAMAYSNMSQLKMLADQSEECVFWGEKAIALGKELDDPEILAHALINVGSALSTIPSSMSEGIVLLQQSLEIALKNSYHEHAARAYTAMGSNGVTMKDYGFAREILEEGIRYCEQRDLDSLKWYMMAWKARLNLETGHWDEAFASAGSLLEKESLTPVIRIGALAVVATVKIRRGEEDALSLLLEAKAMAFKTMELQRIIPVLSALLEYEWITGKIFIEKDDLDQTIVMVGQLEKMVKKNKFYYWLRRARREYLPLKERYKGYDITSLAMALEEADYWQKLGCPYEYALALTEGSDDDKRKALVLLQQLGADTVYEKIKQEMRTSGIKKIPRGLQESTKVNPAKLTNRELDVLQLLKKGIQNKEIADTLFISPKTVDHHISSILFKLDANSRVKAVAEAVRLGILP